MSDMDEVATLRAELYRAKRAFTEGKELANKLETERNQLAVQLNESQKQLGEVQRALEEARKLASMSSELQSKIDSLEAQLHHKTQEVAGLRVEVEREHTERKRAEDMRVKLEAEKVAMQRRRDELASRLAEAEGRAASAEEGEARFTAEFRQLAAERDQLRDALDRMGNGAPAALPAQPPSDALEVRQLEAQLRQLQLQLGSERSARERMESAAQEQISRLTLQLQQQQHERAAAAAAVPSPAAPAQSSSSAVEAREVEQWTKRASDLEERLRKAMLSRDRLLQEFEASSDEVQRLHEDNERLMKEVGSLKQVVSAYDAQLMAALGKNPGKLAAAQHQNVILSAELLRSCMYGGQVSRAHAAILSTVERRLQAVKNKSPQLQGVVGGQDAAETRA